jgi:hypothetical protein
VQEPPTLQQISKRLVNAELKQDIDVFSVFEPMLEKANVRVLNAAMDFELLHELRFVFRFVEA